MPADLRAEPRGPDLHEVPFTSVYLTHDEWAAESANRTVHVVLHIGWVPDGAGYHGQMAVLVKPNGSSAWRRPGAGEEHGGGVWRRSSASSASPPGPLRPVVMKATVTKPEARYRSVGEFLTAVEAAIAAPTTRWENPEDTAQRLLERVRLPTR